jgi:hypothetical protein
VKINVANKHIYIPKWNKNQKLPATEQVRIEYRYMTCEEEEKYSVFIPKYKGEKRDEIELEIKTSANEIWDLCALKVSGLQDENGKEISDPKAVRKIPGTYGLVTELVGIIRKGFDEDEIKN